MVHQFSTVLMAAARCVFADNCFRLPLIASVISCNVSIAAERLPTGVRYGVSARALSRIIRLDVSSQTESFLMSILSSLRPSLVTVYVREGGTWRKGLRGRRRPTVNQEVACQPNSTRLILAASSSLCLGWGFPSRACQKPGKRVNTEDRAAPLV